MIFFKKTIFFLISILILCPPAAADTNVADKITKVENWLPKNSPYVIDGTATIEKTGFVTIYPGTVIKFKKDAKLVVKGALYSKGDPKNPVRVLPYDNESFYNGFRFESRYANTIEFTIIIRGAISSYGTNLTVSNSYILNSTGIELFYYSNAVIKDNYFFNNTYGVYAEGKEVKYSITQNTFNNCRFAVYLKDLPKNQVLLEKNNFFRNQVNLTNYTAIDIEAKDNYWGFSEDKPILESIFDKKNNEKVGTVIYAPYAKLPYKLWEPTDAFISLVKIYLNLKRPDEEPRRVCVGGGPIGMMPLSPVNIKNISSFGIGSSVEFTINVTGAFLAGVEFMDVGLEKKSGDAYRYSMNSANLLINGYGYFGYKRGAFFMPYLKLGNGIAILSEEYKYEDGHTVKTNQINYTAKAGLGVEWWPLKFFSFKLDGTFNYTFRNGNGGNMMYPLFTLSGNIYFDTPLFTDDKGLAGPY